MPLDLGYLGKKVDLVVTKSSLESYLTMYHQKVAKTVVRIFECGMAKILTLQSCLLLPY